MAAGRMADGGTVAVFRVPTVRTSSGRIHSGSSEWRWNVKTTAAGFAVLLLAWVGMAGCFDSVGRPGASRNPTDERATERDRAADWREGRRFELDGETLLVRTDRRDRLTPGRVVEIETADGVRWRKVVELLDRRGSTAVYETVAATFGEAVPDGRFREGGGVVETRANESGASAGPERRVQRALEGDGERASTFEFERQLGQIDALQLEGGGIELSTEGRADFSPGHKVVVATSGGKVDDFEFTVMDQLDLELDWTFDVGEQPGETPLTLEGEAAPCGGASCRATFTMAGRTFVVEPRIGLRVRARELEAGTLRLALQTETSRDYLLGGVVYRRDRGWRTRWGEAFDIEVRAVEAPEAFAGVIDVAFDVAYVLRAKNEDAPMARVDLLELRDRIDARVAPPRCSAAQRADLRARARRSSTPSNPTCLGGGEGCLTAVELFEKSVLNSRHDFESNHPNCELTAPDCSGLEGTDDCPGEDQICAYGRCLHRTPVRIALAWNRGTDLDLVVWDDDGRRLQTRRRGLSADVDGWMAHRSAGPGGGRQKHYEVALLRRVEARKPIAFQIRRKGHLPMSEAVGYQVLVTFPDAFESTRTIDSELQGRQRSMTYRVAGHSFVGDGGPRGE